MHALPLALLAPFLLPAMFLNPAYARQPVSAIANHEPSAQEDFAGNWGTRWCDKSDPHLECGGFEISLVQHGDTLCGDFDGALVNLRQTDRGALIGQVVGDTAILAVHSERSDNVVMVRAAMGGDMMHWRQVGTVRSGGTDIDVIAIDDELTRLPPEAAKRDAPVAAACR